MMGNEATWTPQVFGACDRGDSRRTRRFVDAGTRLAQQMRASMAHCRAGESTALLGNYRLMRNEDVSPEAIREPGLGRSARQAASCTDLLLVVEDTNSVSYAHAAAASLGTTGSRREAKYRGYLVHSILLLESTSERTLGPIEQRHWSRDATTYGKKHARKQRAYEDKESYKWEQTSRRMTESAGFHRPAG